MHFLPWTINAHEMAKSTLAGYVLSELSRLVATFLTTSQGNVVKVEVCVWKGKQNVRLIELGI